MATALQKQWKRNKSLQLMLADAKYESGEGFVHVKSLADLLGRGRPNYRSLPSMAAGQQLWCQHSRWGPG